MVEEALQHGSGRHSPDSMPHLVHAETFDGKGFVVVFEETRHHKGVGEEEENGEREDDVEQAAEDEDDLVGVENVGVNVC